MAAAGALALGIGIQNFPEGAAVALPLHQEGLSRMKSFVYGALSGIVEPLFGVAVVLVSAQLTPFMPWLLSAAAGAMLYVVVEELIPEAHLGEHSHSGTLGVMAGVMKRAPRWMQKAKLEWLFRGMLQPKRAGRLMALPKFVLKVHHAKK